MPIERPEEGSTLTQFFNALSDSDKETIDTAIFNPNGEPLSIMDKIQDEETARQIMGRFRQLLQWKNEGMNPDDVQKEAKDIYGFISRKLDGELDAKAA